MKRILFMVCMCLVTLTAAFAQQAVKQAEIKFDKTTHNFGTFSESDPVVKCVFSFTNVGTAPLIIHQAFASCGCTAPDYTKEPIKPGEKGKVTVVYNGAGKFPGYFKKSITIRSNAKNKTVRLYIDGTMQAVKK